MYLTIFLGVFVILLLIGAPIYMAMLLPSIVYCLIHPVLPAMVLIQKFMTSLNSFPLMAIPFFILAAEIMNVGGITDRIFRFARVWVGQFRGGLGYVNIVSSVIFSGMSGSALADVGGLGQIEIKAMRDAGYDDDFTMGITMASSTVGPIIPPSIPMVVYASYVSVSTGALFIGGIIPGLVMALVLAVFCYVISKRKNYPKEAKTGLREKFVVFKRAFLALCMPVIIIGGIWTGYFTPTEAALVSIVYAIILTVFVYRTTTPRGLLKVIMTAINNVLPTLMVIAGATVFAFIINYEKLDQKVLSFLTAVTDNKYVVLLLLNVFLIFMGMFFDAIVAILLLAPIVSVICNVYGLSMVHVGVVVVLNLMIGLMTPPVGTSLYLLSSVTGHKVSTIIRWAIPWIVPLIISLLIITFCEPLVLFLPNLMGLGR